MNNLKYITLGVFLILIQILISGYINIWPVLYIAVFPFVIIILPQQINKFLLLVLAALLGLAVDFISDGILGLNAAAATALAFFKDPILRLTVSKTSLDNLSGVTEYALGSSKFILYTVLLYSVFFLFYMGLDSIGYYTFGYTLLRFSVNIVVNTIITVLFGKALAKQLFFK